MKSLWEMLTPLIIFFSVVLSDTSFAKQSSNIRDHPVTMFVTVPTPVMTTWEGRNGILQIDRSPWDLSFPERQTSRKIERTTERTRTAIQTFEGRSLRSGDSLLRDLKRLHKSGADHILRRNPNEPRGRVQSSRDLSQSLLSKEAISSLQRRSGLAAVDESSDFHVTAREELQTEPYNPREHQNVFGFRDDSVNVFQNRDDRNKQSYVQNDESRTFSDDGNSFSHSTVVDQRILTTFPAEELQEQEHTDAGVTLAPTTEKMEVISTSSDDRMALIRGRHRDTPQLIFLADDPEAASRLPDLLTTLYDVGSTTRVKSGFSYGGRSGIITATSQDDLDIYTVAPEAVQIIPRFADSNDIERDLDVTGLEATYRGSQSAQYFPPRYRQKFGTQESSSPFDENYGPFSSGAAHGSGYSKKNRNNMTRVTHIEAECQDDFMRIQVVFNSSFEGLVYSSGYSHDLDCVYINGSGRNAYEFYIKLNRCGTLSSNDQGDGKRPMHKNVMWNTLTVQYNPMIEEEWDEHFKVTCEYGLEIWKTVTFPFLDVEVQTGNPMMFTLSPPECHMEIRYGFGPDGKRITSPVRVGDPLTLVIYMRSEYDGFDIVVSDCFAHNGGTKRILLIDSYGCPVDDKLISHFDGQSLRDGVFETKIFAFMKTFRFTGSPALYIECGVRMCHGDCPSQLCHWRRSRTGKSRRSLPRRDSVVTAAPAGNVSESLHLFQALQVIRDDDKPLLGTLQIADKTGGDYCFKTNHFHLATGVAGGLLSALATACLILCLRLRRAGKGPKGPQPPQMPLQRIYRSEFVPPSKRRLE